MKPESTYTKRPANLDWGNYPLAIARPSGRWVVAVKVYDKKNPKQYRIDEQAVPPYDYDQIRMAMVNMAKSAAQKIPDARIGPATAAEYAKKKPNWPIVGKVYIPMLGNMKVPTPDRNIRGLPYYDYPHSMIGDVLSEYGRNPTVDPTLEYEKSHGIEGDNWWEMFGQEINDDREIERLWDGEMV